MFSQLNGTKNKSWEISVALDILGFNPAMVKWRQTHYDFRMKWVSSTVPPAPKEFGPANFHSYLTGSKQEGTSIWGGGDEDWMVAWDRYICLIDQNDAAIEPGHVYFGLEDAIDKPGYLFLKKTNLTKLETPLSVYDKIMETCISESGYISSQRINKVICNTVKDCENILKCKLNMKETTHTFETGDEDYPNLMLNFTGFRKHTIDILPGAILCIGSDPAIQDWENRQRKYEWPTGTVIRQVVETPRFIVPKGFKGSKTRDYEFRVSYTISELRLIKTLNETQLKMYVILKLLFKSEVDKSFPDILTSYCLKNVVFWLCETTPQEDFVIECLLELLTKALNYILDCVKEENLPMYLMPTRNLLEGKLNKENKEKLEELLSQLIKEGPDVVNRIVSLKLITEIAQADILAALILGYMIRLGEIWLVNARMETLKRKGPLLFRLSADLFYTQLQKAAKSDHN